MDGYLPLRQRELDRSEALTSDLSAKERKRGGSEGEWRSPTFLEQAEREARDRATWTPGSWTRRIQASNYHGDWFHE
jgi:hypothetical protein